MANLLKTDSVATIGDFLLKGWTMLTDCCRECKVDMCVHGDSVVVEVEALIPAIGPTRVMLALWWYCDPSFVACVMFVGA